MTKNKIEEIEESLVEVKKRRCGRPKKGEPLKKDRIIESKKTKSEKTRETAEERIMLSQVGDVRKAAEQKIAEEFSKKLPEYVQKRRELFEKTLEDFNIANDVIIQAKAGKVNHYKLSNLLSKPLSICPITMKYTAYDISLCAELYWDCISMANETVVCIPTIYQMASLMGCSTESLIKYKNSTDQEIREVMLRIYDKFVDYYTVKGLANELNTIMSIFALKAQYGLRDNDTPQITVNNFSNTVQQSSIDELEKQFNISSDGSEIIDVEV